MSDFQFFFTSAMLLTQRTIICQVWYEFNIFEIWASLMKGFLCHIFRYSFQVKWKLHNQGTGVHFGFFTINKNKSKTSQVLHVIIQFFVRSYLICYLLFCAQISIISSHVLFSLDHGSMQLKEKKKLDDLIEIGAQKSR